MTRVDVLARSTQYPVPDSMDVFENAATTDTTTKGTLTKDTSFGNLLHGPLAAGLPATPHEEMNLYFDTRALEDLWVALTWGN